MFVPNYANLAELFGVVCSFVDIIINHVTSYAPLQVGLEQINANSM